MKQISYGSLCTGYDGLGMALELAGVPIRRRWMAENDEAVATQVLKAEYPDVPNVGDIKTVPWLMAPHTDIMTSGDPCQSISIAGRQAGRDDPRFLWPWVREAYRAVRPGAIFFENVANIVSHDGGRTLAERFAHLREDGYAVRWTVLGACSVGAPHHRHRWYAVAGYVGAGAPAAVRFGGGKAICGAPRSGGRYLLPSPQASNDKIPGTKRMERGKKPWYDLPTHVALLPTPAARDGGERGAPTPEHAARRAAPGPGRSLNMEDVIALLPTPKASDGANGGPNQRDGAGNYYLPGVANLLPTPIATNRRGNDRNNRDELLLPGIAVRPDVWGRYADAIALWESITGDSAPEPTGLEPKGSRRLSPLLPEWMMGLRPGLLTDRLGRSDALKAAGNGVVPLAAAAAWKLLTAD